MATATAPSLLKFSTARQRGRRLARWGLDADVEQHAFDVGQNLEVPTLGRFLRELAVSGSTFSAFGALSAGRAFSTRRAGSAATTRSTICACPSISALYTGSTLGASCPFNSGSS